MNKKYFICFFLLLFICWPCFAQNQAQKAQVEVKPLLTVTGRVISKAEDVVLITQEAKGYILKPAEALEMIFEQIKALADKDVDVTLSGFASGESQGFRFIDHRAKEAREENYSILYIFLIHKTEPGSKVTDLNISKPIDYQSLPQEVISPLRPIKGRISKCNFKSVIPSLELEGKEGFVLTLSPETQVGKVVGEELMAFKPKEVLKEGLEVEIWYEEKGYLKIARIITIY